MFQNPHRVFLFIVILTIILAAVDLPENYRIQQTLFGKKIDVTVNPPEININTGKFRIQKQFKTRLGLDLSGGTHIVLNADMKSIPPAQRDDALESSRQVIDRRVNFFGVSEPVVQTAKTSDAYRVIVELPGVTDVEAAVALIGQTASLEFREFRDVAAATGAANVFPNLTNTASVNITGKDLKSANLDFSSDTGAPQVALEFSGDGATKFASETARLVNKHLIIFLDDQPLTWPRVSTAITDGRAVITGGFSVEQAKNLSLQLAAGALPVPVSVVEKRTIGASLGAASVAKSVRAGIIGLTIVAIFMIAQYGKLGLLADMALVVYGLMTFALFRLIPVTLTLPGVAGFILSIGMAVDSNILIFERYKEERRRGKPSGIAMEQAFGRAWDSIRDANVTTILTAIILYNPGNWQFLPMSGMVRGFALTLFLGVIVGLFTGIIVTRTFVRVLYREKEKGKI
ncbi:MAG: protein translocase subunit SecD [Candidatus Gottesmanbacteria bacterium]|nr:protein translocase subunit SecD [Candidatus Gottesmanbacteria bacterium]